MPITPLHLGPGAVLKAVAGRRLSITVFAVSQGFMDVEVIGRLLLGAGRLHGFTNTIAGATVALIPSVLLGKPICEAALRWWNRNLSTGQRALMAVDESISWGAAWSGGVLGVYSHWFLDSLMHADARPLWPFAEGNRFVTWLSVDNNNLMCAGLLVLGGALLLFKRILKARSSIREGDRGH